MNQLKKVFVSNYGNPILKYASNLEATGIELVSGHCDQAPIF